MRKIETLDIIEYADDYYKKIREKIGDFEEKLTDNQEIAFRFSGYDGSILIDDIGFHNRFLIVFYGELNGDSVTIVQDVRQINFMLIAVPKKDGSSLPFRLFSVLDELSD